MQQVSTAWAEAHAGALLGEAFIEISYDVTDPDAHGDVVPSASGALDPLSRISDTVAADPTPPAAYATLEDGLWLLDGSRRVIPASGAAPGGFVGSALSDASGAYSTPYPALTLTFSVLHEPNIPGVTVTWSTVYGEYASSFRVTAYNGSSAIAEKTVTGNTSVRSVVLLDISSYDRIVIEVLSWCLPYRRARMEAVFVGIRRVYTRGDLTAYRYEASVDPISAEAPMGRISFSLDNRDDKFDPTNDAGMSKYLTERQKMTVRYGQRLGGGSTEYIPGGVFYLSEWDAPQNGLCANFTARDICGLLAQGSYIKGVYRPAGATLYSLAADVLTDAGIAPALWSLDESLKTVTTVAPLPVASHLVCLQYIAAAAGCILGCGRDGVFRIAPASSAATDYALTAFNMFERPEISLSRPLGAVRTKVYSHTVGSETELASATVAVDGTREVILTYSSAAVDAAAMVTGGTLASAEYWSGACRLTLSGSGNMTVTVRGKALSVSSSAHTYTVGDGEAQEVDDPLVTSSAVADSMSAWVAACLGGRKTLKISSWRADPRLDAGDIVTVAGKYTTESVRVTSLKYQYSGAFRGSGEGRVI